jgi:hypothetical protein
MINQCLTPALSRNGTVNDLFYQCAPSNPRRLGPRFVNALKNFARQAFTTASHFDSNPPETAVLYPSATILNAKSSFSPRRLPRRYALVATHEFDPQDAVGNKPGLSDSRRFGLTLFAYRSGR